MFSDVARSQSSGKGQTCGNAKVYCKNKNETNTYCISNMVVLYDASALAKHNHARSIA